MEAKKAYAALGVAKFEKPHCIIHINIMELHMKGLLEGVTALLEIRMVFKNRSILVLLTQCAAVISALLSDKCLFCPESLLL
jgi:hypothetical protein